MSINPFKAFVQFMRRMSLESLAVTLAGALISLMPISSQANPSSEQSCMAWSLLAKNIALARDSGQTYAQARKRISLSMADRSAFTTDNVQYAQAIVTVIYKDFHNKSPDDISLAVLGACEIQKN